MNSAACVGSAAAHAATAAFTSHPYYCHDGGSSSATAASVLSAAASGVSSAAGNWSAAPAHANGKFASTSSSVWLLVYLMKNLSSIWAPWLKENL